MKGQTLGPEEKEAEQIRRTMGTRTRYVRKWVLRQAFIDAVLSLPVLSGPEIAMACPDFDTEDMTGDADSRNPMPRNLSIASRERRHAWMLALKRAGKKRRRRTN